MCENNFKKNVITFDSLGTFLAVYFIQVLNNRKMSLPSVFLKKFCPQKYRLISSIKRVSAINTKGSVFESRTKQNVTQLNKLVWFFIGHIDCVKIIKQRFNNVPIVYFMSLICSLYVEMFSIIEQISVVNCFWVNCVVWDIVKRKINYK